MSIVTRIRSDRQSSPRRAPVKSNSAAREVNIIDWCYDVLADADAAPNHRVLAIGLLNEDGLLGRRFVPPAPVGAVAVKAKRTSVSGQFSRAVTAFLGSLGYQDTATAAILSWFAHRGTFAGCPVIDGNDAATLADAVQALSDRQDESGDLDPRYQAVAHVARDFQPSKSDSRWWAAESATIAEARIQQCRQKRIDGRRMGRVNGTCLTVSRAF